MTSRITILGPVAAFLALAAAAPASAQYYPYPQRPNRVADEIARVGAAAAEAAGAIANAVHGTAERFAVNACGARAQRYGRVGIGEVYPKGERRWRVRGIIEPGSHYGSWGPTYSKRQVRRTFTCTASYDGRVTKFKTKRLRY